MKYKSDYVNIYFRKNVGERYKNKIENRFESFIFRIEKDFIGKDLAMLKKKDKLNYLDFACGTGRIIKFVIENFKFKSYTGLDISPEMISQAKKDIPDKSARFEVLDVFSENQKSVDIPLANVVTCFRLILNLEPEFRSLTLKKLNSLMSEGGILIINNHMNRYSFLGIIAFFAHKFLGMPLKGKNKGNERTIINTMTYREMKKLLNDCGFEILKVHRFCMLPGHKKFLILPEKILFKLEKILSGIPFLRLLSKDQIYLCRKIIQY